MHSSDGVRGKLDGLCVNECILDENDQNLLTGDGRISASPASIGRPLRISKQRCPRTSSRGVMPIKGALGLKAARACPMKLVVEDLSPVAKKTR